MKTQVENYKHALLLIYNFALYCLFDPMDQVRLNQKNMAKISAIVWTKMTNCVMCCSPFCLANQNK